MITLIALSKHLSVIKTSFCYQNIQFINLISFDYWNTWFRKSFIKPTWVLEKSIIEIVFALQVFIQFDHQYIRNELTDDIRQMITIIINFHSTSAVSQSFINRDTRNFSQKPSFYSFNWATNKNIFCTTFNQFSQITVVYRNIYLLSRILDFELSSLLFTNVTSSRLKEFNASRLKQRFVNSNDLGLNIANISKKSFTSDNRSTQSAIIDISAKEIIYRNSLKFYSSRSFIMSDFTETQQCIIAEIVRQILAVQSASSSDFQKSLNESDLLELNETNNDIIKWNVKDLNFFDSLYDEKSVNNNEVIIHTSKNTYFRDVHLFIERIKNFVMIKDAELIRDNFWTCFWNTALI